LNISIHLFYLTPTLRSSGGGILRFYAPQGRHAAPIAGVGPQTENFNNYFTKFSKYKSIKPGTGASFARFLRNFHGFACFTRQLFCCKETASAAALTKELIP